MVWHLLAIFRNANNWYNRTYTRWRAIFLSRAVLVLGNSSLAWQNNCAVINSDDISWHNTQLWSHTNTEADAANIWLNNIRAHTTIWKRAHLLSFIMYSHLPLRSTENIDHFFFHVSKLMTNVQNTRTKGSAVTCCKRPQPNSDTIDCWMNSHVPRKYGIWVRYTGDNEQLKTSMKWQRNSSQQELRCYSN